MQVKEGDTILFCYTKWDYKSQKNIRCMAKGKVLEVKELTPEEWGCHEVRVSYQESKRRWIFKSDIVDCPKK